MKYITYTILGLGLFVGIFFAFNSYIYNQKQGDSTALVSDPKNASYVVDQELVKLTNGVSEVAVPNSSAKVITKYFGNELSVDLNADGREDTVFFLTQEKGGSGTFFYVAGAVNTEQGIVGIPAVLLGDRIAPQTIDKKENSIVVVNYADRKPSESFTTAPSVGKSIWLKLDIEHMQFGEVVQNFEGEANPDQMTLDMNTWDWVSLTNGNGVKTLPKKAGVFNITFKKSGSFEAMTDCNMRAGEYSVSGKYLSFSGVVSTQMYCEDSQEGVYGEIFSEAVSYVFTSKGELILTLKNGGSAVFR